MILACPSCGARFMVDASALPSGGRTVKCGKCSHRWHAEPEPEDDALPLTTEVEAEPELVRAPSIRQRASLGAIPTPRRRRGGALAWGLLASILMVLGGILWFGREPLIALWPATEPLYAAIGLVENAPSLPGEGLELAQVTPRRVEEAGIPYLVIDGEVVNASDRVRPVPDMLAVLRDAAEQDVQQWTFTAPTPELRPGERVAFSTRLANPSDQATGIKIEFTESADTP